MAPGSSEAISLSPSAVSYALGRLRVLLKDELFVRTVARMEPTAPALEMAPLVRDALVTIERAVGLSVDQASPTASSVLPRRTI